MVSIGSNRNEYDYKIILAQEFGDLSESILRQKPPFNKIASYQGLGGYYFLNYLKYKSDLDIGFRKRILEGCVASAKWKFQLSLLGRKLEKLPFNDEVMLEFKRWIKQREQEIFTPVCPMEGDFSLRETIENEMKNKLPEFKAEIVKSDEYVFSYPLAGEEKIYIIVVDEGFLNFNLGVESINYQTDIAAFFDGTQSFCPYSTAEELYSELNDVVDVISLLIDPVINVLERMR
jgi:hypothetical protein